MDPTDLALRHAIAEARGRSLDPAARPHIYLRIVIARVWCDDLERWLDRRSDRGAR